MKNNNISTLSFSDPIMAPVLIPVEHKATPACINNTFMVNGTPYGVTALSFGSPHGVVVVEDVDSVDVPALGSALGNHVLFPQGASIVFIQMVNGQTLKARLWQRGEGEAAFSPEGACVAGTAAMMLQKTLTRKVNVQMGGRESQVEWYYGQGVNITGSADLLGA